MTSSSLIITTDELTRKKTRANRFYRFGVQGNYVEIKPANRIDLSMNVV